MIYAKGRAKPRARFRVNAIAPRKPAELNPPDGQATRVSRCFAKGGPGDG
jgi:hypothetical protein